jgi:ComF family protein
MGARADSTRRFLKAARHAVLRAVSSCAEAASELVPDTCALCHDRLSRDPLRPLGEPGGLCPGCAGRVVILGRGFCLDCVGGNERWNCVDSGHLGLLAATQYGEEVASLVSAAKYQANPAALAAWRDVWRQARRNEPPAGNEVDLLVPVPPHPARVRERGFDVTREWAGCLARLEAAPVAGALIRRLPTPPQVGRDRERRRANVAGAFAPGSDANLVRGRRLALVDDVVTTGATLREARVILLALGARSVVGWSLAYEALE